MRYYSWIVPISLTLNALFWLIGSAIAWSEPSHVGPVVWSAILGMLIISATALVVYTIDRIDE